MKIKAISHISHDGKMIEPGKTGEVSDAVGKHLVKSGSAVEVKEKSGGSGGDKKPYTKEGLMKLSDAELAKIGKKLGAKETIKEKLVDEIIDLQKKKS